MLQTEPNGNVGSASKTRFTGADNDSTEDPEWSYCFDPEEKEIPPGTAPECSCFTVVKGYDKECMNCDVPLPESFF